MINKHSIQKLQFEIHGFSKNSEYQAFANRLSTIVKLGLSSRIDKLFNKYSIDGYHFVINKLEIDVGYINIRNLENNLLTKLQKSLEKHLKKIKVEVEYRIANNSTLYNYSSRNYDQITTYSQKQKLRKGGGEGQISNITDPNQINRDQNNIEITLDGTIHKFDNLNVMPNSRRFLEAVLFYLEFGYLPRHLHIPQKYFSEIFSKLVLDNQEVVIKHFGRKSPKTKAIALSRLEKQITEFSKSQNVSQKDSQQITHIFDKIEKDKLQILSKSLNNLTRTGRGISTTDKKRILKIFAEVYENYEDIYKVSSYFEMLGTTSSQETRSHVGRKGHQQKMIFELDAILKTLNFSPDKKKYVTDLMSSSQHDEAEKQPKSFWLFKTEKEKFMEKMEILLDSRDKSAFEKLLKTSFVESISSKYHIKEENTTLLVRGLLSTILNNSSTSTQEILDSLPDHIDSVKELLNQLYSSTPSVISAALRQLNKFEKDPVKRRTILVNLTQNINKKHLNLILQSIISNYPKLATSLNFVNKYIPKEIQRNSTPLAQELQELSKVIPSTMLSQIYLLSKYTNNPSNIGQEIVSFINKTMSIIEVSNPILVAEFVKKRDKRITQILQTSTLKERTYDTTNQILQMSIGNILTEIKGQKTDKKTQHQKIEYEINTLLTSNYIPTSSKILQPKSMSTFIKDVSKAKVEKSNLLKWFNQADILKNRMLRKLSKSDFHSLLETVLPTDSYRRFISLKDKYDFIWKTGIDDKQIQLIFLDLMQWHSVIDERNIFSFFFDRLQKYKGWTNEFHKKRIIERFEIHSEKLLVEERDLVIAYIDSIKTLESIEMKETRKMLSEGIPVKNAGLALLWPFFKTLFTLTGLVDKKGEFLNIQARERATLLLQYLAVGSSVVEEPYLALNKIMTGYPLEETVANEIVLTEKERDISDALLLNVIRQWPSFENSSANNLRGSFIIRDGILAYKNQQWVLTVENKAYDLLLGKLPWGFGLIRLAWLPYMIKVEWN